MTETRKRENNYMGIPARYELSTCTCVHTFQRVRTKNFGRGSSLRRAINSRLVGLCVARVSPAAFDAFALDRRFFSNYFAEIFVQLSVIPQLSQYAICVHIYKRVSTSNSYLLMIYLDNFLGINI